ncbi:hypothetical protein [Streptomyces sp. 7N604]|uniref:hypothetical protein n=1 Tax=Streptomyces sp. 7N604 TaxID=3457415 RepID=UPI003FD03A01
MHVSSRAKKAGAVLAAASARTFLNAPFASANWTSSISSWTDGQESRHSDEQGTYSQVLFRDCFAQYASSSNQRVDLLMWQDISFSPDRQLDRKVFTNCFNRDNYWSNGEWTDVPSGDVTLYFEADKIGSGGSCCLLFVSEVYQDTSLAD